MKNFRNIKWSFLMLGLPLLGNTQLMAEVIDIPCPAVKAVSCPKMRNPFTYDCGAVTNVTINDKKHELFWEGHSEEQNLTGLFGGEYSYSIAKCHYSTAKSTIGASVSMSFGRLPVDNCKLNDKKDGFVCNAKVQSKSQTPLKK